MQSFSIILVVDLCTCSNDVIATVGISIIIIISSSSSSNNIPILLQSDKLSTVHEGIYKSNDISMHDHARINIHED